MVRKITASVSFDEDVTEEEAIQTLAEAVCDDGATVTFDGNQEPVVDR